MSPRITVPIPRAGIVRAGRLRAVLSRIAPLISQARGGQRVQNADGSFILRLPEAATASRGLVYGGGGVYRIMPCLMPSGSDGRVQIPTFDGVPVSLPHLIRVDFPPAWFCVAWPDYEPAADGTWHQPPLIIVQGGSQPPQDVTVLRTIDGGGAVTVSAGSAYITLAYLDHHGVLHQFYTP